jgi:hypothetical protein
MNKQSFN